MKRFGFAVIAFVMVGGLSYAVDYTYTGGAIITSWDNDQVWTPTGVPGADNIDGVVDTLTMPANVPTGGAACQFPNGTTWYIGALHLDNGEFGTPSAYGAGFNIYVLDDQGESGDFIVTGTGTGTSGAQGGYINPIGSPNAWVIDGDFRMRNGGIRSYRQSSTSITMNGSGKTFDSDETSYAWGTVTIANGASITTGDGPGDTIWLHNFVNNGTFSGNVEIGGANGSAQNNGTWDTGTLSIKRSPGTWTASIAGGTYPNFDGNSNGYINGSPATRRTVRLMGDVTIAGDCKWNVGYVSYSRNWHDVFDTDNGDGETSDLMVNGDFSTGGSTTNHTTMYWGLHANDSTIDIEGSATYDKYAYVLGGTSTWKFAGDVTFTDAFVTSTAFDNVLQQGWGTDMSGTTVVIDGSGDQALDFAPEMALGDVTINKSGGTATLTDNVLLAGNLEVLAGGLDTNEQVITFNGPDHLLRDSVGVVFDNVALLADAVVQMASDITIMNLMMDTNSEMYLNGFTLDAEGTDYSGFGQWSFDNGIIFGDSQVAGDSNGDGKVDGGDLAIWQQNYDPLGTGNNTFALGDWNNDGKIDGGDLALWQQNYDPIGPTGVDGMGANVPEPTTLLLLGTGLIGAIGAVRRRRVK